MFLFIAKFNINITKKHVTSFKVSKHIGLFVEMCIENNKSIVYFGRKCLKQKKKKLKNKHHLWFPWKRSFESNVTLKCEQQLLLTLGGFVCRWNDWNVPTSGFWTATTTTEKRTLQKTTHILNGFKLRTNINFDILSHHFQSAACIDNFSP